MPGSLIVHGGGTTAPETTKTLIARAGGPDALIVLLAQTSQDTAAKAKGSLDWLKENGARNVTASLVARTDDAGGMRDLLSQLEKASGFWIPGGDQNRFYALFENTPVPAALRAIIARGGAGGGTSAGASLIGEWMPTGEGDRTKMLRDSVEMRSGLNLWPGVLVDTHFFIRERTQRLANMILSRPEMIGIGIDQDGWIEADRSKERFTVRAGQVMVMRAAGPVRAGKDGALSCADLRVRVLAPGDSADIAAIRRGG